MENIGEHSRQGAPMYSDDDLMPLLQELHNPTKNFDSLRLYKLSLVEKLINRATETIGVPTVDALVEDEIRQGLEDDAERQIIGSVSCQITREILNGKDAHTITIAVLKYLRDCGWEYKAMLTLTAFALTFTEFWLLVRIFANNAVNEPMTVDQSEPTTVNKDAYKIQIEANNKFIKTLVNTNHCLIRIKCLNYLYPSYAKELFGVGEGPYMHTSGKSGRLSVYVYWIMRCAIVAATQIIILSSRGLDQYLVGIPDPKEFDKLNSLNQELILKFSEFDSRRGK
ncbi:protein SIEVE ELEMENT OCCLUSION B-like [Silene latifolia]|uniref:protein SIEVE ELEMENT OCCLUSION B-like n=1 Tax=Silene latifolia TaxID=37657 RepID=UPI003D77A8CC